jgi:4-diphosphocytidyl-2-C-methyl-D-erythritol kinase
MVANTVVASSDAKLNVFLEVMGKRADGFHALETLMLRTHFCDQLAFRATDDGIISLKVSAKSSVGRQSDFPLDDRNLIVRVAQALQQQTGCPQGCEVTIEKHIPPESGLGGGSSNAATTLRCLNSLWNLDLSDDALHEIAAAYGSDINFLLSGVSAAVCRGRGEIVEPVQLKRTLYFVAVRPATGNATASVFRGVTIPPVPRTSENAVQWLADPSVNTERALFNRLTAAARNVNPEMSLLMDELQSQLSRPVFMSGSGSTVFVVASNATDAAALHSRIEQQVDGPVWLLTCGQQSTTH